MTRALSRIAALVLALSLALAQSAAAQADHPPESAVIGAEQHPRLVAQSGGEIDDPALRGYVDRVGRALVSQSDRPDAHWRFTVLDTPMVNAFALPGGYVYVSRGLLALARDEAQLAAVVAHEIIHVTANHVEGRADASQDAMVDGMVSGLLTGLFGGGDAPMADAMRTMVETTLGQVADYSRAQEYEADLGGIALMARAGYDPMAAVEMLTAMSAQHDLVARMRGSSHDSAQVPFLALHPAGDDRVAAARAEAALYAGPDASRRAPEAHLAAIDGMVFGDTLAEGLVRGQDFLHPGLGLRLTVPGGWHLANSSRALGVIGPDGQRITLDAVRDPNAPGRYLSRVWAPELAGQGMQLAGSRRVQITDVVQMDVNSAPVAMGRMSVRRGPGAGRETWLAVVRHDDRLIRLVARAPREIGSLPDDLRALLSGLHRLEPEAIATLRPWRLALHVVAPGDTPETLAARMALPEAPGEWFALLNGLGPGQAPAPGAVVKLVVE